MYILGISCFYHDSAAALIEDGKLIVAAEEERFTRVKHDSRFPENSIKFCLDFAKIDGNDLDYVVFYEKPLVKFERIIQMSLQMFPKSWRLFKDGMTIWVTDKLWIKNIIKDKVKCNPDRILFSGHHLSHAASAYYCSPFNEASILTVDGVGEWATATLGEGKGNDICLFSEMHFPHSLGLLYSTFTAFLGFEVNEGEYKVMGMSSYGKSRYIDRIYKIAKLNDDGSLWLDMDYFAYHYSDRRMYSDKFIDLFGEPRIPESPFRIEPCNYYADIAASIQKFTEVAIFNMLNHLYSVTKIDKLCIGGGVGLNSLTNGKILKNTLFKEIFIQPAAGDSGGAVGAAMYVYYKLLNKPRNFTLENVYLGKQYSNDEVKTFLDSKGIAYKPYNENEIVNSLIDGKVIGWFQGRFEFAPRALGNRSILADPRNAKMKDLVNTKIKFREPFRPFAPVILEDNANEYFENGHNEVNQYPSRFMLFVLPFKENKADILGAINHMGTGRLQTLRKEWNPRYYSLIEKFEDKTGVPVLLNTSFNLRGEPIVESPANALSTFSRSGLDMLVLGDYVIGK